MLPERCIRWHILSRPILGVRRRPTSRRNRAGFKRILDSTKPLLVHFGEQSRKPPASAITSSRTRLSHWWADESAHAGARVTEWLGEHLIAAVLVGGERTLLQDAAFGMRQLVDIALKALSPAINQSTTVHCSNVGRKAHGAACRLGAAPPR
jgi:Predicted membrane protein (DUF2254)